MDSVPENGERLVETLEVERSGGVGVSSGRPRAGGQGGPSRRGSKT